MLLLEFVDIEMEKSEEEIVHSLRGNKASSVSTFKSAKNTAKNIRCRWATRHLAAASHRQDEFVVPHAQQQLLLDCKDSSAAASALSVPGTEPQEDREDGLLQVLLPSPPLSQSQDVMDSSRQASEQLFDFTSEAEVVSAVTEASEGPPSSSPPPTSSSSSEETVGGGGHMEVEVERQSQGQGQVVGEDLESEDYRRCCKVWLKLMSMSQAKGLLWEVDENMYPGYFDNMQRPLTLVSVAYKLLQRSYPPCRPGAPAHGVSEVAACFYRDMRQVFVNCIAYNSEATVLYGHAQKLLQVLHRHMQQWVFSRSARPASTTQCEDGFCLHSHLPLAGGERGEYRSVKCGRCAGVFSLEVLQRLEQSQEFIGIFSPTQEEVVHTHEDWLCFLCLREDGVATAECSSSSSSSLSCAPGAFHIDEWGPSSRLPWHLNTQHILQLYQFTEDLPTLPDMVKAVQIIAAPHLTPLLPPPLPLQLQNTYSSPRLHAHSIEEVSRKVRMLAWTMRERLQVYAALCELLKSHEASHDFMTDLYKECTALTKMSVTDSFCEANFIEQVQRVAGGGVAVSLAAGWSADGR